MKRHIKIIIICFAVIIYLISLILLAGGPALRMFLANRQFQTSDFLKARNLYENMAKEFPSSPYVDHNLGLCLYQFGRYNEARSKMNQALKKYKKEAEKRKNVLKTDKTSDLFHYHFGNTLFKSAPEKATKTQDPTEYYLEALKQYKQALLANPENFEAKYNYELALLRLGKSDPPPQQPPPQIEQTEEYLDQNYPDEPPPSGKNW